MSKLTLTSSEMRAWQTCQRGWWLTYYRGLRAQHDLPSLANIGNLVHDALERYYNGEDAEPARWVAERADEIVMQHPNYADQVFADAELASIMLQGYFDWVEETGADAGLTFIGAEQMVEAEVGPFILRGKIDARMERDADGALMQLEHKTVGNLGDHPSWAQSNPQFLTYDLLAFLTKPDGRQTDGVLLNMLRRVKRTARAKPPFYGRLDVRHNVEELRSHYRHVVGIGVQIEEARQKLDDGVSFHEVCPPAQSRSHQWSCSCAKLNEMFDDGSAVEDYLAEFYEKFNPLERYEAKV